MLVEQLNTRRSICSIAESSTQPSRQQISKDPITLGAILEREAVLHQSAHLKAAMHATSSRIQSLEKELNAMKNLLDESEKQQRSIMVSARSASFHYGSENKIERGDRGSNSSGSFRFCVRREKIGGSSSSLGLEGSSCNGTPRTTKNIRQRLMNGLKSAFRVSKSTSKDGFESRKSSRKDQNGVGDEDDNAVVIVNKENLLSHRNRGFVV
jgi:hypothetical protein